MLTREKWQCFNALEHYLNQQGIDLDSVADDEIEMDDSARIYVFLEANIEGVEIVKENMRYFVPLLEYNGESVMLWIVIGSVEVLSRLEVHRDLNKDNVKLVEDFGRLADRK